MHKKKQNVFWILLAILCGMGLALIGPAHAHAQSKTLVTQTRTNTKKTSKKAYNFIDMSFDQEQFFGESEVTEQDKQYSTLNAKLQYRGKSTFQAYGAFGVFEIPLDGKSNFEMAVPELFYRLSTKESLFAVTLGREKRSWSELDQYWGLGLWQPLARWDITQPIDQGLTGAFIDVGTKYFRLSLFGSPVYLPDQAGQYDVVDGKIVSSNRWFRAPVSQAEINYGKSNIYYHVNEPEVSDVISNESYAAQVEVGAKRGFFGRFSAARKPMNQFHLAIDSEGIYHLENGELHPEVYPLVVKHTLYTTETGYHGEYTNVVLSWTKEAFDNPQLPTGWEETSLIDATYSGVFVTQNLSPVRLPLTNLKASYVRKDESTDPKESTIIKGEISASTQRIAFDELVQIGFNHNFFRTKNNSLDMQVHYTYSLVDDGEWISGKVAIGAYANTTIALQADIFGVPDGTKNRESFISQYRENDRVMGSLTYVF